MVLRGKKRFEEKSGMTSVLDTLCLTCLPDNPVEMLIGSWIFGSEKQIETLRD